MKRDMRYRRHYGAGFPEAARVFIDAVAPLCKPLLNYFFELDDTPPVRLMNDAELRWLNLLTTGPAEGIFKELIQKDRYGGSELSMKKAIYERAKAQEHLEYLLLRFQRLQKEWIELHMPRLTSRLPHESPMPKALAIFLMEWGHELSGQLYALDRIGTVESTDRRNKLLDWATAFMEADWPRACRAYHQLLPPEDGIDLLAALNGALLSIIHGKWVRAGLLLVSVQEEMIQYYIGPDEEQENQESSIQVQESLSEELVEQTTQNPDSETNEIPPLFASDEEEVEPPLPEALERYQLIIEAITAIVMEIENPELRNPLDVGAVIGTRQWQLLEPMGMETWKVLDADGHLGILEEMWPVGDDSWMDKTQGEALALSQLRHDHIAPISDWGVDPVSGRWYMVHHYLTGLNLLDYLSHFGPMSEAQTRAYFLQILSALKICVRNDVHHRQLRPESLIFPNEDQLVITRFGIHREGIPAWQWSTNHTDFRTQFYAPEVWESGDLGISSDIYSLGQCIVYALAPDGVEDRIPLSFREIIQKATAQDPADRYPHFAAFERALQDLKTLYRYRGNDPDKVLDELPLTHVVALILQDPTQTHELWQPHRDEWVSWREVDEISQVVEAALLKEMEEREAEKKRKEREAIEAQESRKNEQQSRRSMIKSYQGVTPPKRRGHHRPRAPQVNLPALGQRSEEPGAEKVEVFDDHEIKFSYIPAGDFLMGTKSADPLSPSDAKPHHLVKIQAPFLLSRHLVTQKVYEAVTGEKPSYFLDPNRPVEQINWFDAALFCNSLSEKLGYTPAYSFDEGRSASWLNIDADGFRLPFEHEWEYAANAGKGVHFSGGESWEPVGWFQENSDEQTQPVGLKRSNSWNLFDMSGNVYEWCTDAPRFYLSGTVSIKNEWEQNHIRAIRGGSWRRAAVHGEIRRRAHASPHHRRRHIGIRIARPLPKLFVLQSEGHDADPT